jgi:hypothetical protein
VVVNSQYKGMLMLLSDLPLATVSVLSLTSVTGIGGDKKLEEEKKKTEAERQKNGKKYLRTRSQDFD